MVVSEMLQDLPNCILGTWREMMELRLLNHHSEDPESLWCEATSTLIPKKTLTKFLRD